MHEVAIAQSILDIVTDVARENNAQKILNLTLKAGELSCVNLDSLQFVFSCISQKTMAEGATILVDRVKGAPFVLEVESIEVE
ncbi:TPA: hypothetical protein DCX15_02325 [bacterium]|nr:hypothetical protein [bacterium]